MSVHLESCNKRLLPCQLAELGCNFQGCKNSVMKHEQDVSAHINVFTEACLQQKKLNEDFQHQVEVKT